MTATTSGQTPTATWEPGLGDHLRNIWRYKWFVLGGAIVIAELAYVLLLTVTPRYEAEASVRLSFRTESGLLFDEDRVELASRVYAELAESQRLIQDAVDRSEVSLDVETAESAFEVSWARPPGFIDVAASAERGEDAAALADGMALALIAAVEADTGAVDTGEDDRPNTALVADLVEPAGVPTGPASPRPLRDSLAAFVIALVVLAEVAALWRPARGLLPLSRTAERVSELVGIPTLTLTGDPDDRTRMALFAARHLSDRTSVLMVHCNGEPLPAAPVRLAEAVTAGGRRALVVDGGNAEPNIHRRLGLPMEPGLAEWMNGHGDLEDAVFESETSPVSVLTAGHRQGDATTAAAPESLQVLANRYDLVIINVGSTQLLDGVAAAAAEQPKSTILVLDPDKTKRRGLGELVHGYGGHDGVVGILLLTRSAAATETTRLASRLWRRNPMAGRRKQTAGQNRGGSRSRRIRQRA